MQSCNQCEHYYVCKMKDTVTDFGVSCISFKGADTRSDTFNFTIPLEPRTKKNSGQILKNNRTGKLFIAPSKVFNDYQTECGWFIPVPGKPIDKRINIKALYYMGTHRRVDIANLHSALHDVLVHYGVIKDDNSNIVVSTDGSRVLYDKNNPRTEVYITSMEGVE